MKKNLLKLAFLFLIATTSSCSGDDAQPVQQQQEQQTTNGINFAGEFYPFNFAYVDLDDSFTYSNGTFVDVITIRLANKDYLNSVSLVEDVDYAIIKLRTNTLAPAEDILTANFFVSFNNTYSGGYPQNGTTIVSQWVENSATLRDVSIVSVTDTNIHLTYTFNRNDGEVIEGSYNGSYQLRD